MIDQTEAVRQETVAIIDRLSDKARDFELLSASIESEALGALRPKLSSDAYDVLVVGEAKRGKSTLVNALIGRDVLPTDVDVATSQVFRISSAGHEAYRLRFEDESAREIAPGDLPLYGSQRLADAGEAPRLDQIIRWIEVEVPIRFLRPGINLLDTPGLGALYAAHAQITQRFVPYADAVIFVLDSGQPIGQLEIDFLDKLLAVTQDVFFVQTKIDQHRREEWQEILRRNQEILAARFGDRLAEDVRVWPISSTNLMKAAQTGDEDYLAVSRHKEFYDALQAFLFHVAGSGRVASALLLSDRLHGTLRQTLSDRLLALSDASNQTREELQRVAAERMQQLDAEWGEQGQQRQTLMANIQEVLDNGKQGFLQILQPGGKIEQEMRDRIDALASVREATAFGEQMAGMVIEAVGNAWQQVCQICQSRCAELLGDVLDSAYAITVAQPPDPGALFNSSISINTGRVRFAQAKQASLRAVQRGGTAYGIARVVAVGALTAISGVTLPVGAALAVLYVALYGPETAAAAYGVYEFVRSWKSTGNEQLDLAREQLHSILDSILDDARMFYISPDPASGYLSSRVDETFDALGRLIAQKAQTIAADKRQAVQAEIEQLEAQSRLDDSQRQAQAQALQSQLDEWDGIGRAIHQIAAQLEAQSVNT